MSIDETYIQSPPKVLEQDGQLICFCNTLNTFGWDKKDEESSVFSCALSSSAQPTGLGQGTDMAVAEPWFCVQLSIFVLLEDPTTTKF